jgi:hypothetical protein
MTKQIEALKRQAEQGSPQAQGEAAELELEDLLRETFPTDALHPVQKGHRGADILHEVRTAVGRISGSILWESKEAKWNNAWVQKLKDDQRAAGASVAIIVTRSLPEGIQNFGYHHGVWVCNFGSVVGLSMALRLSLAQLAEARTAMVGKGENMEIVYNYFTGPEFRNFVEGSIESFNAMKSDLDAERRSMERMLAKRERQLERVVQRTAKLCGDLEALSGGALTGLKCLAATDQETEIGNAPQLASVVGCPQDAPPARNSTEWDGPGKERAGSRTEQIQSDSGK